MNTNFKLLFIFTSLFILITGCDGNIFDTDKDKDVQIRIENSSEYTLENIRVSFPEEEVSYGTLDPADSSDYRKVKKAYRYAYIESEIDGQKAVLQPIDYVGEDYLEAGTYTYQLFVYGESGQNEPIRYYLGFELKKN
ncbi:hypothetical protein [Gracilimonas sp.]|uniref:hypothetical protein n=1 Tax=Gracilimonas sp. TaxID=1974203 RepID=UPI0032EB2013